MIKMEKGRMSDAKVAAEHVSFHGMGSVTAREVGQAQCFSCLLSGLSSRA